MNEPEELWYTSFDGRKIQGWILKPPAFEAAKKYPLILQIHGGPHAAYGNTFTHEFQSMAGKGYVVLYTNPRGSSNYGQDFGNIIQYNYPGDDYKDLMAGVDEILKKGYIDETRLDRHRRERRRPPDQLGRDPDQPLQGRGQPARHLGLGELLVHGRLHALHADVVPEGAVRGSRGLRQALADHSRRQDPDAADVHPRRRGLADAAGGRRRGPLSRAQVSEAADGDGAVPRREPRALAIGPALAPRRTPPAHRRLVRQVGDGPGECDLRRATRPARGGGRRARACSSRSGSADARQHPARRVRPLSRQQRSPLLPPRRPRRSGQEVPQRQERRPLQDAAGRHADSARPLRQPEGRQDPARHAGTEVRARAERRLRRLSRDAQARPRVHHRLPLLRHAARDRPLRRHRVPQGPGGPPLDQHRLRGRGLEHLVAEQGPVARRGREHATSASSIPNDLVDVSNGRFVGKTDLGDGYTRWDWQIHYPINSYNVSLNIGALRALLGPPRRPDARLLRAAREPREGQGAVRAGQADDRGVSRSTSASIRSRRTATS